MPRKPKTEQSEHSAPEPDQVTVTVIAGFEGLRRGSVVSIPRTARVEGLLTKGLLKVVDDGTGERGPVRDPQGSKAGGPGGADDRPESGPEHLEGDDAR